MSFLKKIQKKNIDIIVFLSLFAIMERAAFIPPKNSEDIPKPWRKDRQAGVSPITRKETGTCLKARGVERCFSTADVR